MTSRFVSTGAIDAESGDAVPITASPPAPVAAENNKKQNEWAAVQAQLEAERQAREAKRKADMAGDRDGKSLFEVLEANKAAKQAAFEEANKISNQFRALDEDEIGFLEEVEQRKREEAERVRRETEEGLRVFREARKGDVVDEVEGDGDGAAGEGGWKVGGKRKRRKEGEGGVAGLGGLLKGVKRRSSSGAGGERAGGEGGKDEGTTKAVEKAAQTVKKENASVSAARAPPAPVVAATTKPKLGLVDYGSDDDSD